MALAVSKSVRSRLLAPFCLAAVTLASSAAAFAQLPTSLRLSDLQAPVAAAPVEAAGASLPTKQARSGAGLPLNVVSAPHSNATFSATAVGATSSTVTLTFTFPAAYTVTSEVVLTSGAANGDFKDLKTGTCYTNGFPYSYASAATCTVMVNFAPTVPGIRNGYVGLNTSANTTLYGYITGVGNAALTTFSQATNVAAAITSGYAPYSVALDGSGDLWAADSVNGVVKEYVPVNGVLPSTPTNTFTGFTTPQGLAIDGAGTVYIGDGGSGNVYTLQATNGVVASGTAPVAYLSGAFVAAGGPLYVAVNEVSGYIYALGYYASTNPNVAFACSTSTGSCSGYVVTGGAGMAVDGAGSVYIANGTKILKYAATLKTSSTVSPTVTGANDVAIDAGGNLYITTTANTLVEVLAASGATTATSATRTLASAFSTPRSVVLDSLDNVYIADSGNMQAEKIDLSDPPTLAYANTTMGNTSPTQTITLQNTGNTALSIPAPASGSNPSVSSNFMISSSSTCPQVAAGATAGTVAYGATCTYIAAYQPTTNGATVSFFSLTDNSLNVTATQNAKLTGSTGGLTVAAIGVTAAQGSTSVGLEAIVGWGGGATPTGTLTITVQGSATGVGAITCTAKAGHNNCTAAYNASSLPPGNYTITATQAGDSNYSATPATGILSITGSSSKPAVIKAASLVR